MIAFPKRWALLLAALLVHAGSPHPPATAWKDWHPPGLDRYARFLDAILRGDANEVRASLDSGMSVDWRTATGLSPVLLAAAAGRDSITLLVLPSADPACWPAVAELAIRAHSLGVLEWLDREARHAEHWNWERSGDHGTPLEFAISQGVPDTIFEFLLARRPRIDSAEALRLLDDLCGFQPELAPRRKVSRAHRILDAWSGFQPGAAGGAIRWPLGILAENAEDTTLLRRAGIRIDSLERRRRLDGNLASPGRSTRSIDSLLALGADPLAPLGIRSSMAPGLGEATPLGEQRTAGYRMEDAPALAWRTVSRFVRHDSTRVAPRLSETDRLMLAVATGDLSGARHWIRTHGTEFASPGPHTPFPGGHLALALAADAGDTAMTRLLLPLPFRQSEREHALERAVRAHSPAVVQMLLASGVDARLPARGGKGPVELLHPLFDPYLSRRAEPQDTAIARMLLEAAYGTADRWHRLPLTRWAIVHPQANPVLLDYLWRRHPASMDADTLLLMIGGDHDRMLDSRLLERVGARGHEARILEGVCRAFAISQSSAASTKAMMASTALLDTLLARGYALDSAAPPGWICHGGFLEFRFDARSRRFAPAWRIRSPFSEDAAFDTLDDGGDWFPASSRQ